MTIASVGIIRDPSSLFELQSYQNIVSVKDPRFGAKGTGTDDTSAFISAINSGILSIIVPKGTYIISQNLPYVTGLKFKLQDGAVIRFNTPQIIQDLNGVAFESDITIESGGTAQIQLNGGAGPGFRISGSSYTRFRNVTLQSYGMSTPSTIGILYQRSTATDSCQWNNLDNVVIDMHTDTTANGGKGTIGLYNDTAELTNYNDLTVFADLPAVITRDDLYAFATVKRSLSMKDTAFTGSTSLIASGSYALVLEGVSNTTFTNLYMSQNAYRGSNTQQYACLITGTVNDGYENYCVQIQNFDVEMFGASFNVQAKLRNSLLQGNHQTVASGYPVIKVTTSQGQMTETDIKIHVVNPTATNFDLINTDAGSLENDRLRIWMPSTYMGITMNSPFQGCVVYSNGIPRITNENSSAQSIHHFSEKGYGINTSIINFAYGQPTAGNETEGSVFFNQSQNAEQGNSVGWVYNGSSYVTFGQVGYQQSAGSPVGVLTPRQMMELAFDSTNKQWYISVGTTSADWHQITN